MRVVFGVLGLLVVLAIVGVIAKSQLQGTRQAVEAVVPGASGANVVEQSRRVQEQVKADVTKALEQAARTDEDAK